MPLPGAELEGLGRAPLFCSDSSWRGATNVLVHGRTCAGDINSTRSVLTLAGSTQLGISALNDFDVRERALMPYGEA